MNYLGKFVTGFKYFYDEINHSNLTGAMDVVIVKNEVDNGKEKIVTYKSSPFHVKFGKYDVLRPKERRVDIAINGIPVDVKMQLGRAGEAYFPRPNVFCDCKLCLHRSTLTSHKIKQHDKDFSDEIEFPNSLHTDLNVQSDSEVYDISINKKKRVMSESETDDIPNRNSRSLSQWEWGELPTIVNDCHICSKSSKKIKKFNDEDSISLTSEGDIMSISDKISKLSVESSPEPSKIRKDDLVKNTLEPVIDSSPLKNIEYRLPLDCRISLCGDLINSKKKPNKFEDLLLTYETLTAQPTILYDKDVVVEVNGKYYSWMVAAPIIISSFIFKKKFPEKCIKNLKTLYKKKKKMRGWFVWRNNSNDTSEKVTSDDDNDRECITQQGTIKHLSHLNKSNTPPNRCKRRILKLESENISKLGLHDGANDISFTITTKFQGTVTIHSRIFLWNKHDKIVISDIDGTITKSDVLGHVMYFVGKEWVHRGVTTVLNKIQSNGYRIMYLSSRTIGIADITRNFIQNVNTDETRLPEGPILLSPSSLFQTIHAEIVENKPEIFKIGCLKDISSLFPPTVNPFYSGFGNRVNDAIAYKAIDINDSRIFIINNKGCIRSEHCKYQSITFNSLLTYISHIFPPIHDNSEITHYIDTHNFSDLLFWKGPYLPIKPDDQLSNTNEPSSTNSSFSNSSNRPNLPPS